MRQVSVSTDAGFRFRVNVRASGSPYKGDLTLTVPRATPSTRRMRHG